MPLRVGLALVLAVALNDPRLPFVRIMRTALFLPVVTTGAIVGVVMRFVLDPIGGPINVALLDRDCSSVRSISRAASPRSTARSAIWVWKWLGVTLIYWLAALQTIPKDLYEAASIDGAGRMRAVRYVTIPLLVPFLIIITLLTAVEATNVFDLLLTLTGGGPFYATEVIDIFVYRQAFAANIPRLGYASAAALFFGACIVSGRRADAVDMAPAPPGGRSAMIASERRSVRLRWGAILTAALLALLCLLWVYPFLWLLSASLKEPLEIFSKGLNLIPDKAQWENYARAWSTAGFAHYMLNTILVTVGTVVLVVLPLRPVRLRPRPLRFLRPASHHRHSRRDLRHSGSV